jgi:hypothetical protein
MSSICIFALIRQRIQSALPLPSLTRAQRKAHNVTLSRPAPRSLGSRHTGNPDLPAPEQGLYRSNGHGSSFRGKEYVGTRPMFVAKSNVCHMTLPAWSSV